MRRYVPAVVALLVGVAIGYLLTGAADRSSRPTGAFEDYAEPITLRRVGQGSPEPPTTLRPHSVQIDGKSKVLGTPSSSTAPIWIIWLHGGRVQIGATEEVTP